MNRKGMWLAAAVACALAAPLQTLSASSGVPVGSTVTAVDLCPDGPSGTTYPGPAAPSGCSGDSTGATTVTLCRDANVHAFVKAQVMVDGKRPSLAPVQGTVAVNVESATYGNRKNVDTSAEGTGLLEMGSLAPGTYDVTASLWTGTRIDSLGNTVTYPASKTTVALVVSDSPCGAPVSTTASKNGCGVGDANHTHDLKNGKACPTK
jgi:hypothetical protein